MSKVTSELLQEILTPELQSKAFLTTPELMEITGLSRNSLYRLMPHLPHWRQSVRGPIRWPTKLVLKAWLEAGFHSGHPLIQATGTGPGAAAPEPQGHEEPTEETEGEAS